MRAAGLGAGAVLLGVQLAYLFTPRGDGDVRLYHAYASAFWTGAGAFRRLPVEYPPLALGAFSLSLAPPLPGRWFLLVYGLWMAAGVYLLLRLVARAAGFGTALVAGAYLGLACFATLLGRYDLVPALCTVGAVLAAGRRRFGLAHGLLAAGILLKLYPVFLLPILAAEQWRVTRSGRGVAAGLVGAAAVVAAGLGAAAAAAPGQWLSPFTYGARRPLQVESLPASIAWLASGAGVDFHPDHSFHSYNVASPLAGALVLSGAAVLALTVVALSILVLRGRLPLPAAAAIGVGAVIVTAKVLSPQYLTWLLPLVALAERRPRAHWLLVGALTTAVFPIGYDAAGLWGLATPAAYPPLMLAAIAARNLLLVLGLGILAVEGVRVEAGAGGHQEAAPGRARGDEVLGDRQPRPGHG